jgi:hypothetical protein
MDETTVYEGTGTQQAVTATAYGFGEEAGIPLGAIGSISADGKLSITIPATIPDSKFSLCPNPMAVTARLKGLYLK